jgi:serine phosphatase RsbU (regulator of sigma subunit)
MNLQVSITSTETFAARAQRSEATRVILWIVVLVGMLAQAGIRRGTGGHVMAVDGMFFPYVSLLTAALIGQVVLFRVLRRANRASVLLPGWVWRVSAIGDLAVGVGLLAISGFLSPRGPMLAMSSPPLLLLPLVVLMSVLRLRPNFTLYTGRVGAACHLLLAVRALVVTGALPEPYPVALAYGFILVLTAVAGMFVAKEIRKHVLDAVEEGAARERVDQQMYRIQHDLSVARDIQQGLLPRNPPRLEGFEITGMNRPADQTGGDYYDWQELPDGRLAVVLADVSGHGVGPAIVMAVCRAYARATAHSTPDPAQLLTRINELIHGDIPADRFITFVVVVLSKDGSAQLISAGHGPTLLYRAADGSVRHFGGDGIPLGIAPSETYGPSTPFTLETGDVLVMLTDGFFESQRRDGEQFGTARLEESLKALARSDASTILKSMDETVQTFSKGSDQMDDMTAIVIKRTAMSAQSLQPADAAAANI